MKEIKVAIKELPQIDLLEAIDSKISLANSEVEAAEKILAELDEKILEQEEEILLEPEEEIVLEPLARGLQDFPIPRLSRSTNDPSTWEPADDEEIMLVGI
jgi:predicted component of type VI protein secretion system